MLIFQLCFEAVQLILAKHLAVPMTFSPVGHSVLDFWRLGASAFNFSFDHIVWFPKAKEWFCAPRSTAGGAYGKPRGGKQPLS